MYSTVTNYSAAPVAWRAAKWSPILIQERKGNPWVDFLMVIMAGSIAHGRIHTTTMELPNMAATFQIIGSQRHAVVVYWVLPWYWTSMLWSIDTCQNKVSADQYHVTISWGQVYSSLRSRVFFLSWPLTKCWLLIRLRAHIRLTCWKQGRIVRRPVNANPGLIVNWIITFSSIQMCFALLFWVYGDY